MKKVSTVTVIGAGQMGAGIAQICGVAGISTRLFDLSAEMLDRAHSDIFRRLQRLIDKGELSNDNATQIRQRITRASSLSDCTSDDLIIEAIVENVETKQKLFAELDRICKPEAIFASNTSSISITKLAATTRRPEQFIGMHFMNPVPVMQLVEIIRGIQTNEETYQIALELSRRIGKTAVTAHHDYPGFIVNRILIPMLNEACFVLMEGIASVEEIDTAMKLGTAQPMGPLRLADFVGLDTCLAICNIFHRELGEDKYRPCPLLVKYVEAGWLGKKSGRGFYRYEEGI